MWLLTGRLADQEGPVFRIVAGTAKTLGRATGADFIVDAPMVSRIHCRLIAGADSLEIEDLDSTNGTFVNDRRVARAVLNAGDRLRIGRLELTVEHAARAAPARPDQNGVPLEGP